MADLQENPFWNYSLAVYPRSGVEAVLLQLQDNWGADVNLLLCCCWKASLGHELSATSIAGLIKHTAKWRAECVLPLRSVRRFLKTTSSYQALTEEVRTLELEVEQYQQAQIYARLQAEELSAAQQLGGPLALENCRLYCERLPGVDWTDVAELVSELVMAAGFAAE